MYSSKILFFTICREAISQHVASPDLPTKKIQDTTMRYIDTRTSKTDRNQTKRKEQIKNKK